MKKTMRVVAMALVVLMMAQTAFAASPWTSETTWSNKAKAKLVFGLKNLLGGWSEILTEPMNYNKEGKNVPEGIAKGLFNAVVFTIGGALHVITFPFPVDVPLPDNGIAL